MYGINSPVLPTRYTSGARALETHIYGTNSYPLNLIGPATVIWRPALVNSAGLAPKSSLDDEDDATVWVRFPPGMFDAVQSILQQSASQTLDEREKQRKAKGKLVEGEEEVEIGDLRGQLNAYELMGPKATQVLLGVLRAVGKRTINDAVNVRIPVVNRRLSLIFDDY